MSYWNNDPYVDTKRSIQLWSVQSLWSTLFSLYYFSALLSELPEERMICDRVSLPSEFAGCVLFKLNKSNSLSDGMEIWFPKRPSFFLPQTRDLFPWNSTAYPSSHGNDRFRPRLNMKATAWSLSVCCLRVCLGQSLRLIHVSLYSPAPSTHIYWLLNSVTGTRS